MNSVAKVIAALTVLALVILCQQIVVHSFANQQLKSDYAEINHIKYGLFSVDEWKRQLEVIVADEIGRFDLSRSNERELKKQIETQLTVLIDKVDARIHQANSGTFKGRIKQAFINSVVDMNAVKAGIPDYADAMMVELKKTKNERQFKTIVKKEVSKYFAKSFGVQDRTELNNVMKRAGTVEIEEAKSTIDKRIANEQSSISRQSWLVIALSTFVFILLGAKRERLTPFEFSALMFTVLLLLVVGVATPMIDMQAKISSMSFVLLGHEIGFKNQVLYFQSKSIMDVFWLMITGAELPMKLVGLLVVTFSVLFPISKMVSMFFYYFNLRGLRQNAVVEFFVLKSGKWSMSDVLVVAIFMAYVGFSGILSSQLGKLSEVAGDVELLTTNGTNLQPGFYLFFSYVVMGMAFALILARKENLAIQSPVSDVNAIKAGRLHEAFR